MTVHDFGERLAYSHSQSDQPWWETVYRRAFPDMVAMADLRQDGWHQRAGRDRAVVLSSGRTLYVDEKVRSRAYDDVLIEVWSVYPAAGKPPYPPVARAKPGWAAELKDTDWLAYAFEPSQVCYMFPFLGIRNAWVRYRASWIRNANEKSNGFDWRLAHNKGYDTVSISVPTFLLQSAISDAMTVSWKEEAA